MMFRVLRNTAIVLMAHLVAPHAAMHAQSAPSAPVARLMVLTVALSVEVGSAKQIAAEAYDAKNVAFRQERSPLQFTSLDTAVAIVSADGFVKGQRPGSTQIVVRAGTKQARVAVTVFSNAPTPAPVAASTTAPAAEAPATPATAPVETVPSGPTVVSGFVEPGVIQLLPGERFRPTFKLRYADGTVGEAAEVTWLPLGPPVSFDAATGDVIGVVPGDGVLGGTYNRNISHSAKVNVAEVVLVPDRDSIALVAGAVDTVVMLVPAQGRRVVTQNLTWKSTNPTVLRVFSPTAGVIQARDGGSANLTVDGYGIVRVIKVTVTPRIERMETSIPAATVVALPAGGALTLEAKALGSAGTALTSVPLTWRSADTTIARIDARGTITAIRAGSTQISLAAPGTETLNWPVTIAPTRVSLGVNTFAIPTGVVKRLSATLRGDEGRDYGAAAAPVWISATPDIATVDATGNVTARKVGRATIIVSQQGAAADTATVFVTGRVLIAGSIATARGIWQIVGANDSTPVPFITADSGSYTQASWSPDRTRIVATLEVLDKALTTRVVVMDADGKNMRVISPDQVNAATDPSWTPDGTAILMSVRDAKTSSIVRVPLSGGPAATLVSVNDGRVRHPVAGNDSGTVYVRMEKGGAIDLARVRGGTLEVITAGKPREELVARLRDGRLLVAVDSAARSRPSTLQWMTIAADAVEIATPVPVPTGLVITDVAPGFEDGTAYVVARARSWPGEAGPVLVVLRVSFDGTAAKVLLVLQEKDAVTVRSD